MARSITIEDLYGLKFVSHASVAPDGRNIAYVETTIDEHKHAYHSAIWLASVQDGTTKRFTGGVASANSPTWSPDGRWLAFVSERVGETSETDAQALKKRGQGKPQVWIMPTDGGEAYQLTFMEHGAGVPTWSPDSKHVLFSAQVGPADETADDGSKLPKVRVIDRLWYRLDGVGYIYERRAHLFCVDRQGGEVVQLTDGDWDDGEAAWSSDGTKIAFASNRNEDRWRWPGDDVYVLALNEGKPGELRRLTDGTLGCSSIAWSPDDQILAFLGAPKLRSAGQTYVYTSPVTAENQAPTNLSKDFIGSCIEFTNSDVGDEHLVPAPVWSRDGQTLYVLASHRGASRIFALSSSEPNVEPRAITPADMHVRDVSGDKEGRTLALVIGDATHPQEVYVLVLDGNAQLQRISHANDELLQELTLVQPEVLHYKGADGWPIEGWILKPSDFDSAKKYPLLIEVHGGPNTQYGYGFFHEMQVLVAQGYVVFYCNPRGSIGYGYDFADAVRGAWGEKDSIDIMLGADEVIKQGYIDEQRLAVTGGSYGGFMTNWLVGHTDRFKVAITDRCVSNMATMFGTSDIGWDLAEDNLDTTPWENLDKYMHMSPIKYVQNIHTPLLIVHSENDLRCSIEQSEQLYAALKWMGREVEFVRFEGQSHSLSRGGHPKLRKIRLQHMVDWFAKYLQ